jgi:hypothetical protein
MSTVSQLMKDGLGRHWLSKQIARLGGPIKFLESPFEEQDHEREKRKRRGIVGGSVDLHTMAAGGSGYDRFEDNYLYFTRRFPGNTVNNTIGAGALVTQANSYFTAGINDPGTSAGYASLSQLTYAQTNMGTKGQIPKGVNYKLREMGVSFNATAKVPDILALLDAATLSFNMGQGGYLIPYGPIVLWPGGTGPYGFATTTATTTTIQGGGNGAPSIGGIRQLGYIREFGPADAFEFIISTTAVLPVDNSTVALTNFTELRIQLFGQYSGPVI